MPIEPWTRPIPERIVLVGFMAAGKSTVGRMIAARLGWELVDLDEWIERRTGRTPGAIIREDGEPAFRRLEAELTRDLAGRRRMVLAAGGGWGADHSRLAELGPDTVSVWLRVSAEEAVRRVAADGVDRPLLGPPEGRLARAESLLEERERSYAAADHVVDVSGRAPEDVADEIVRRVGVGSGER